jgi:hypothetical protein
MNLPDDFQQDMQSGKQMVMLLAIDVRTQYTDGVEVTLNNAGVVMTFTQAGGMGQAQPIAKVGMSLQQAEAVSGALQQALLRARYGRPIGLPAPRPTPTPKEASKNPRQSNPKKTQKDTQKDA